MTLKTVFSNVLIGECFEANGILYRRISKYYAITPTDKRETFNLNDSVLIDSRKEFPNAETLD